MWPTCISLTVDRDRLSAPGQAFCYSWTHTEAAHPMTIDTLPVAGAVTSPAGAVGPMALLAERSRAYGGPAHGRHWHADFHFPPPAVVWLRTGGRPAPYRLVRRSASGKPARDHFGNFMYVAVVSSHGHDAQAQ
jgi:hypothetical protein